MGQDASNIDLSRYTEGNPTLPGVYDVSVYSTINQLSAKTSPLLPSKVRKQACITLKNLLQFHINQPDIKDENAILLQREEELGTVSIWGMLFLKLPFITTLMINDWTSTFLKPG